MTKEENKKSKEDFEKLLDKDRIQVPQVGDAVKGIVVSASKAEVKIDIDGVMMGIVRGPELYEESEEYAGLKPGDEAEATVIDEENENNELELSFKFAGQQKAWENLREAFKSKEVIKIKITDANKGGLLSYYRQIPGFLPVSQLAPENYPRVSGGDKAKILEKLKKFAGTEMEVKVVTLDEEEGKIIFSEKDVWSEAQKDVISKYKVGIKTEGQITAVTNFGVFVSFGENMEGLIHISELAWQRIDNPADLHKVGDKIKAEVINIDGAKIFLSAKKLMKDPWEKAAKKYKTGHTFKGMILKVNPFGLFVKLDADIHGLAHISQLDLAPGQKINELFKANEKMDFEIMNMEPKEHRLGLKLAKREAGAKRESGIKNKESGEKAEKVKKVAKKDPVKSAPSDAKALAGKKADNGASEKKVETKKETKKATARAVKKKPASAKASENKKATADKEK